jgi:N-acetylglucosaminyldiphosphoundecaprenol N-acetyl-beta-D-mannosaminyltransferase
MNEEISREDVATNIGRILAGRLHRRSHESNSRDTLDNGSAVANRRARLADAARAGLVDEDFEPRRRRIVSIFGVRISDVTKNTALGLMASCLKATDGKCRSVFIANAHTLNLSVEQPGYLDVLNSADFIFNDGTGVRWAARHRGIELRANLVGTDLIPELFHTVAGHGFRYYLLGASASTIEQAAAVGRVRFPGWHQVGYHHGYLDESQDHRLIHEINKLRPDLLLVGMGNPTQERWILRNQPRLRVALAVGVGGIFDHWINRPRRAPLWVRRMGCEWMHKLLMQPYKWRRYIIGNPKFLLRMVTFKQLDLSLMQSTECMA